MYIFNRIDVNGESYDESKEPYPENASYYVYTDKYEGKLSMARSFGDFYLKLNPEVSSDKQAVIAVPEIKIHSLTVKYLFLKFI